MLESGPRLGIGLYTPDLAARLTDVSRSTLTQWRASGLVQPAVHVDLPHSSALYTYNDLGAIICIRRLRELGLSRQPLRKAAAWLAGRIQEGERWVNRWVWTDRSCCFGFADARNEQAARDGKCQRQGRSAIFLPDVMGGLFAGRLKSIASVQEYLSIDPEVQCGQPVLKGTRLTTRLIAGTAGEARDVARVQALYPDLSPAAILAAIRFEQELDRPAA